MKKIKMITRILLPMAGGTLIARLATSNAREDYSDFKQPPLSPPGYVFPIVWSGLYLTMGTAYHLARESSDNPAVPISHYTQLGLNFIWSILYFKYKLRGTALIESFTLLSAVLMTCLQFYKVNKTAGRMMIPYTAWCAFASYLNGGNWWLNKDNEDYTNQ